MDNHSSVRFTEEMKGHVTFGESDFERGEEEGRRSDTSIMFHLTIEVDDLDGFAADPKRWATAEGWVGCPALGGRLSVERGDFNLFVDEGDPLLKRMLYRLFFRDGAGHPVTLTGFKTVRDHPGADAWSDTTTLYVRLLSGHVEADAEPAAAVLASGIIHIQPLDFARQLTTFRASGPSLTAEVAAVARFGALFAGQLWQVYARRAARLLAGRRESPPPRRWVTRPKTNLASAPSDLDGAPGADGAGPDRAPSPGARARPELHEEVVPFQTADGMACNLVHVHGEAPDRGPVILVHGAGVRANLFRAPVETTLVDALVSEGYDVWMENWRASIDLPPNPWTLDQAAVYDHPRAVQTVVERTGSEEVRAVIHCQGSTSFMLSAVAGLVPQVKTVVTNAVSLHPIVPPLAELKITRLTPVMDHLIDYMDPQWGLEAPTALAKALVLLARVGQHECHSDVCKMVTFTYGYSCGFPTLWDHENLNDETHEWIDHEFAHVPVSFFRQMARSVTEGYLVPVEGRSELPANPVAGPPRTDARFAFLTGEINRCFLPESQKRTFELFDSYRPDYHSFHVLPSYGHLDPFLGKRASRDVFPLILEELER